MGNYIIDLEERREVLYGLLYNLLAKELEVLKEYLDDALAEGWVRLSIGPVEVPILSVFKIGLLVG